MIAITDYTRAVPAPDHSRDNVIPLDVALRMADASIGTLEEVGAFRREWETRWLRIEAIVVAHEARGAADLRASADASARAANAAAWWVTLGNSQPARAALIVLVTLLAAWLAAYAGVPLPIPEASIAAP